MGTHNPRHGNSLILVCPVVVPRYPLRPVRCPFGSISHPKFLLSKLSCCLTRWTFRQLVSLILCFSSLPSSNSRALQQSDCVTGDNQNKRSVGGVWGDGRLELERWGLPPSGDDW